VSDILLALIGTRRRVDMINADVTVTMEALDRSIIIVTGDASGMDAHVKRECERLGFRLIRCHARKVNGEWAGKWAGPERNTIIARLAHRVIAWPGSPADTPEERQLSAGTWNCIDQFRERGKPVEVRDAGWRMQ
jgi:hypothetical protein